MTENGVSDRENLIEDNHRIGYYMAYINEVLKGRCTEVLSITYFLVHIVKSNMYMQPISSCFIRMYDVHVD